MKPVFALIVAALFSTYGCAGADRPFEEPKVEYEQPRFTIQAEEDPLAGLDSVSADEAEHSGSGVDQVAGAEAIRLSIPPHEPRGRVDAIPPAADALPGLPPPLAPIANPFFLEGVFVPSGWMGDGEDPDGPLQYETCRTNAYSEPTCEKWIYCPPGTGYEKSWIGVAYQGPTPNNWGGRKGVNLAGSNYTMLTFMARGAVGGERISVRSGGCTSDDASYPASHEATIGTIVLKPTWQRFEIPLNGSDLSNVCSAFSFTINRGMAPDGCVFYLDDIALR